ncbi:hypothetical protein RIF29_15995 [Crotalaria pallida]|uniref:F-box domain-containing protein n=1 Tax=Crotalaria pallida TaxID=3830 RepID=A0AAN9FFV7_CROPI
MDRISHLPEGILHKIMSMLPEEDVAETLVLSKTWFRTWSSFPFLDFDESQTSIYYDVEKYGIDDIMWERRNTFYNFVDKSLLRFQNQGSNIKQIKLSLINKVAYPRIDYWMKLASKCGVEVLHIKFMDEDPLSPDTRSPRLFPNGNKFVRECYDIPSSLLEIKSLINLSLERCFLFDQGHLNHPIKLSSLKVLCLRRVEFRDKQVFQNLLASCPSIEYITLYSCYGIDYVSMHDLSKLKGVTIVQCSSIMAGLEVDAPSLENFHLHLQGNIYERAKTTIKIDKCMNLNKLFMKSLKLSDEWFLQHRHIFTLLQTLELRYCIMPTVINMSFPQLKVIKLEMCDTLEKAYIDAPNLNLCDYTKYYHGGNFPSISFLNCSSESKINVNLFIRGGAWNFLKLREFFQEFKCTNISAILHICSSPYGVVSVFIT